MKDITELIIERVVELRLRPDQKFRVEVSQDLMHDILCHADSNGTKYIKLDDDSYTFWLDDLNKWSPKVWLIDSLSKGVFNIILVDK